MVYASLKLDPEKPRPRRAFRKTNTPACFRTGLFAAAPVSSLPTASAQHTKPASTDAEAFTHTPSPRAAEDAARGRAGRCHQQAVCAERC